MLPERLNFLNEFDNFYNSLVLDLKENKYNEAEFYLIVKAKIESMDRERLESYRKRIAERIHKGVVEEGSYPGSLRVCKHPEEGEKILPS